LRDGKFNKDNSTLVITCLDHIENEYRFTYKDEIITCNNETEFVVKVAEILNLNKILISSNEDSKNFKSLIM
jgi:hypothetical protein